MKTFIVHVSVDAQSGDVAKTIVRECIKAGAVKGYFKPEQGEAAVVIDAVDEVEEETAEVRCYKCGWKGAADDCNACISPLHDLKCPKCGTTDLDTSGLNQRHKEAGNEYSYGNDNYLKPGR